jgi:hypothetical protein
MSWSGVDSIIINSTKQNVCMYVCVNVCVCVFVCLRVGMKCCDVDVVDDGVKGIDSIFFIISFGSFISIY